MDERARHSLGNAHPNECTTSHIGFLQGLAGSKKYLLLVVKAEVFIVLWISFLADQICYFCGTPQGSKLDMRSEDLGNTIWKWCYYGQTLVAYRKGEGGVGENVLTSNVEDFFQLKNQALYFLVLLR